VLLPLPGLGLRPPATPIIHHTSGVRIQFAITRHETQNDYCKEQHCCVLVILQTCSITSKRSVMLAPVYAFTGVYIVQQLMEATQRSQLHEFYRRYCRLRLVRPSLIFCCPCKESTWIMPPLSISSSPTGHCGSCKFATEYLVLNQHACARTLCGSEVV